LKRVFILSVLSIVALSACSKSADSSGSGSHREAQPEIVKELVVYSSRKEQLVEPLFNAYTAKTGVKIKFVTDKAEPLIQKLKAEGQQTPADIFMTVDAGNLSRAATAGLLQELQSSVLEATVPANLKDPNNQWFGLSQRARTIVYSPERIKAGELSSYEALGDENLKGRLCLRIVKSWIDNLATEPFSNDTKAMEAVLAGQCDVTVVNTYYLGRLLRDKPDTALKIFWPNQTTAATDLSGVHVNISGAGIVKHAKHPKAAKDFMNWLVSAEAQTLLANGNLEYPVSKSIKLDPIVAAWGEFNADEQSIAKAGALQPEAVKLMDRVGYY